MLSTHLGSQAEAEINDIDTVDGDHISNQNEVTKLETTPLVCMCRPISSV